jgi:hypothetical protein
VLHEHSNTNQDFLVIPHFDIKQILRMLQRSNRPGGGLTALVAGAEMLRSGGHASGSEGLHGG